MVNMQVSTVVISPYPHRSAGRADVDTATRGLTALSPVYLSQPIEPCILPIDALLARGDDPPNPRDASPGGRPPGTPATGGTHSARTPLGASYWIPRVLFAPEVTVNPGGGSGWDEPPLDIQIPDDARELDREVLAYRRELRAKRRRDRMRRLAGPFAGRGTAMPLLASILAVCLVAGAMLSVATFSPTTAPADPTPKPTAAASTAPPSSTTARPSKASPSGSHTPPGLPPPGPPPPGPAPPGPPPPGPPLRGSPLLAPARPGPAPPAPAEPAARPAPQPRRPGRARPAARLASAHQGSRVNLRRHDRYDFLRPTGVKSRRPLR